ncbi:hypothetical protein SY83_08230 [Paenibacillus swuensis]|uniref:Polysaccharide chain length determinant N-terminal domain-containing protein n=1 Tax=Paenibacillus swuensis TaxID=1178515 RepID=A0A172TH13_9BACL|nr:Wzz/FepE/Etk N-terminal domain-containing protein [Paenibacillus swuensis]ANE46262.1 hypothetical protein SY83_08230 [Paenibacillus swuensis]
MVNPNSLHNTANPVPGKEINLKQLWLVIKGRIWMMLLFMTVFTALGVLYEMKPEIPTYEVSTRVVIKATPEMLNTLKVMVREPAVMEQVIQALNLPVTESELRDQIQVSSVDNSLVAIVTVADPDPVLAAKIANTTIEKYKEIVTKVMNFTDIKVLSQAVAPPEIQPLTSSGRSTIILSLLAGMILGIGIIFLLESLDDSIKTERDVEQWLDYPVLGAVSRIRKKDTNFRRNKGNSVPAGLRGDTVGS